MTNKLFEEAASEASGSESRELVLSALRNMGTLHDNNPDKMKKGANECLEILAEATKLFTSPPNYVDRKLLKKIRFLRNFWNSVFEVILHKIKKDIYKTLAS